MPTTEAHSRLESRTMLGHFRAAASVYTDHVNPWPSNWVPSYLLAFESPDPTAYVTFSGCPTRPATQ